VNQAAEQRFWSKVDRSAGADGCWLWLAAKARGYGRFLCDGKVRQAHQVAYELATGEPVGDGLNVGHTCHSHACVNPAHLRTTTKKQSNENRRGPQRNSRSGVRNVCKRGNRWRVVIGHEGTSIYVGTFDSLDEADAAARAKRNELFTANYRDRVSA
jgi:HNH endonuclease